jgi:hypothetical protein
MKKADEVLAVICAVILSPVFLILFLAGGLCVAVLVAIGVRPWSGVDESLTVDEDGISTITRKTYIAGRLDRVEREVL